MEEFDVMVRCGEVPHRGTGADRRRRRNRRPAPAARRSEPGTATETPPVPRRSVCVSGPGAAGAPGAVRVLPQPVLVGDGVPPERVPPERVPPERVPPERVPPERVPRTRACLVPARTTGRRTTGHSVRTRTERFLIGLATVLCSAVVVVVLGLLADSSAGHADAPADGVGAPSSPGVVAPR